MTETLNALQIPFLIVGSLASSVHGIARGTLDVDLVADVRPEHIPLLVAELRKDFYIDPGMIQEALRANRSFNVIHFASSYKFDIFPIPPGPYHRAQFANRIVREVSLEGDRLEAPIASAEDTVLSKLVWYRAGGEVSDKQWSDIRGILEVRRDDLDLDYLRQWARHLKVADLLGRALAERCT